LRGKEPADTSVSIIWMKPLERIAIFAALQWECAAVRHGLRQVRRDRLGAFTRWQASTPRRDVWVIKTGVGIERAAAAVDALGDASRFALLVSTGCAGGLDATLRAGDLVVATTVQDNGTARPTDDVYRGAALAAAQAGGVRTFEAPLLCSPTALLTCADKRAAAAAGAVAVDMEGGPIAAAAARAVVPFIAVRAVLDGADDELRVPRSVVDPATGSVRRLALAAHLAAHPGTIRDLIALQRMQRAARQSLERFFTTWLT
jgi:nucleoside phosphorylase